jgi:Double zinc ribbon/Adenylate and Guanylate cyclase catalytic domain
MRCHNCSTENPQGARFCIQCADPLKRLCQKCRCESPPEARFCAQCAAPLDTAPIRVEAKPLDVSSGERRHLTVLFCDLVGSTAIAAQLDPEEWREIVADYHRAVGQAIERFDGYVAQYFGDGVTLDAVSILKDKHWQSRGSHSVPKTGSCPCWPRAISGADGRWFRRGEGTKALREFDKV